MNVLIDLATQFMRRIVIPVLAVCYISIASPDTFAQLQPSEYDLKAAFLYQFTTFVEWPPGMLDDPGQHLVIAVVGARELADSLERLSGERSAATRQIDVRRVGTRDDLDGVHLVFVDERITRNAENLLMLAIDKSVLTVTESDAYRPQYSIINFEIQDNKVHFDVSLALAQQANLRISARMLQFALRVISDP